MGSGLLIALAVAASLLGILARAHGYEIRGAAYETCVALFLVGACIVRAIERLKAPTSAKGE